MPKNVCQDSNKECNQGHKTKRRDNNTQKPKPQTVPNMWAAIDKHKPSRSTNPISQYEHTWQTRFNHSHKAVHSTKPSNERQPLSI